MLSVGFIPASSLDIEDSFFRYDTSFIQTVGADFNIAGVYNIFTTIDIRETKAQSIYFDPYRADFTIGMGLNFRDFKFGITHECNHDVVTGFEFNSYNGWEGAWMNITLGWSRGYTITDKISLTPAFFIGYKPYDNLYIKSPTRYYFIQHKYGNANNSIYGKLNANFDLFDFLNIDLMFQPEFSLAYGKWNSIKGNIRAEGRFGNIYLGFDWTMQTRLSTTAYAVNEFTIFLSFRGGNYLF